MKRSVSRGTFDVYEYHRMAEAGILTENDRVELIEGELTEMSPTGSRHAVCVDRLNRLLARSVGDEVIVRVQSPVRLDDLSEPEPDVAILRHREDFYSEDHPGPEDVLLLIEAPDKSPEYDRTVKLPLYARHGISEAWVVDLTSRAVEAYSEPVGDRYTALTTKHIGQSIEPGTVSGLSFRVEDAFG